MYSLLFALCCALSFGDAFSFMVEGNGAVSFLRQFLMRFPRSQMGACTVTLRNEAEVPLVFLGSDGGYWKENPPVGTVLKPGESSNSTFQLDSPGLFEFSHWGWLYFAYDIPSIGRRKFFIFAEVSATSAYDRLGAGPYADRNSGTREEPYSEGRFGMTDIDRANNKMKVSIFDKDLWSAELTPATWMDDLSRLRPAVLDWPLSQLKYPGQHDAGSFGNKKHSSYLLAWSWQCTDKNLYHQARSGVRWFDIRLSKRGGMYWPFHGLSDKTGDPLAWRNEKSSISIASEDTLLGQVLQFLDEHPNEIMMIQVKFKRGTGSAVNEAWQTIFHHIGDRLIKPPADHQVPTLRSVRGVTQRIILFSDHRRWPLAEKNAYMMEHIWNYRDRALWRGGAWNQRDWDKHNMNLIVEKTEDWMRSHINNSTTHIFYTAQCALTPSFPHQDYWRYPSRSPKALAKDANPFTRERITNRELYKQNASIITMDWASSADNVAIAAMNFDKMNIDDIYTANANETVSETTAPTYSKDQTDTRPAKFEDDWSGQIPVFEQS